MCVGGGLLNVLERERERQGEGFYTHLPTLPHNDMDVPSLSISFVININRSGDCKNSRNRKLAAFFHMCDM